LSEAGTSAAGFWQLASGLAARAKPIFGLPKSWLAVAKPAARSQPPAADDHYFALTFALNF